MTAVSSLIRRTAAAFSIPAAFALCPITPLEAEEKRGPLLVGEVLASVQTQYPPYLAALIEQDIANGRTRQALGSFDLNLNVGGSINPAGYYDGQTGYAMLEQPFSMWGGSVYGGYRLSSGFLPNYNKDRTGVDGEAVLGFRVPLLRDGTIDKRRAMLWQSQIDQELADPYILRQYLDFTRAATIAYYGWLSAGQRLRLAEELLRIAKDRDSAIAEQVKNGASAPIVKVDNERLVVSREIAVVQATRRFQATSIELSLFYRTRDTAEPILASRSRLPAAFPPHPRPDESQMTADIGKAAIFRPEIRRIELTIEKAEIDRRLAKNNLMPSLDVGLQAGQAVGRSTPKDIERTELEAKIEFKLPLQRREAKGRLDTVDAQISRLQNEKRFARDRIVADVRDSYSALIAAYESLTQTRRNVELARQLQEAEAERLKQGATDLLALQIREQAGFDAKVTEVEAQAEYFRAQANYRAAIAADVPMHLTR
ncbi:TolC family protein [Prosthecobacter sp.]|uniref:TolC family protein n=1 Tax=Prosthecobacter sp. TaxID=1965333 RepID=UPI001E1A06C9|nr:TolC family protein [Prosthecobacter sp.]MCB1279329.1 TolC family protein [Prosthecobacter sp.]